MEIISQQELEEFFQLRGQIECCKNRLKELKREILRKYNTLHNVEKGEYDLVIIETLKDFTKWKQVCQEILGKNYVVQVQNKNSKLIQEIEQC